MYVNKDYIVQGPAVAQLYLKSKMTDSNLQKVIVHVRAGAEIADLRSAT